MVSSQLEMKELILADEEKIANEKKQQVSLFA
jgi:hypothetical protein